MYCIVLQLYSYGTFQGQAHAIGDMWRKSWWPTVSDRTTVAFLFVPEQLRAARANTERCTTAGAVQQVIVASGAAAGPERAGRR